MKILQHHQREEGSEADGKSGEELAHRITVQRAREGVGQAGDERQEAEQSQKPRPETVGFQVRVRVSNHLFLDSVTLGAATIVSCDATYKEEHRWPDESLQLEGHVGDCD